MNGTKKAMNQLKSNRKIIYIGSFGERNTASRIRVENVSKIFEKMGFSTDFISDLPPIYDERNTNFHFVGLSNISRLCKLRELLTYRHFIKQVFSIIELKKPKIVILYNSPYKVAKKILNYCHKHNIKVIHDTTEWYEINFFKKSLIHNYKAISVTKRILLLDKKINNFIAISPYMNNYYKDKRYNTIMIPPVFIEKSSADYREMSDTVNIIYAGSPGAKDDLSLFLKSILRINTDKLRFIVNLYGIDDKYLENNYSIKNASTKGIIAHGYRPNEEVIRTLKRSDFSFLIRPKKVYSKAGFSTKFAESLYHGVPVICNEVGSGDLFIENGKNGFKINSFSEVQLLEVLKKILVLKSDELEAIKQNAFVTGEKNFFADYYERDLRLFIERI
ncbi:glycosyltransferase family 4 protein [Enterococcus casseliflavus]|nr:glycosyltransferase family 4 protein [Enterococcus casseliflavus]